MWSPGEVTLCAGAARQASAGSPGEPSHPASLPAPSASFHESQIHSEGASLLPRATLMFQKTEPVFMILCEPVYLLQKYNEMSSVNVVQCIHFSHASSARWCPRYYSTRESAVTRHSWLEPEIRATLHTYRDLSNTPHTYTPKDRA